MVQTIQIKRKFTGAGVPATLAPGELAFNSTGNKLYVGGDLATVQGLVGAERQLEIQATSPAQTVDGGAKTFPIAKLKVPGGNVGEVLSISAADGTLNYIPVLTAAQQFVGSFKGSDGSITFTTQSGHPGPGLPAPAVANNGHYVIADTAGATVPAGAGAGVTGPFNVGDWIISNGTAWTHLAFGGIATSTAADVGVAPAVMGGDDVQEVLEAMEDAFVVGPALSVAGNIATYSDVTGHLIADGGTALADIATVTYVDSENDAQDLLITANAAAIALKADITYVDSENAAQDTAIDNKITKPAAVAAVGNIATYADVGGLAALDGGRTIAQLDTAIAARGDVFGPAAVVVADNLAAFDTTTGKLIKDSGQSVTSLKAYVDTAIAAIPGAVPPVVTAPELTGDGAALTPITFTGITAEAVVFGGKGLSTDPLLLLVVDGGTYT